MHSYERYVPVLGMVSITNPHKNIKPTKLSLYIYIYIIVLIHLESTRDMKSSTAKYIEYFSCISFDRTCIIHLTSLMQCNHCNVLSASTSLDIALNKTSLYNSRLNAVANENSVSGMTALDTNHLDSPFQRVQQKSPLRKQAKTFVLKTEWRCYH